MRALLGERMRAPLGERMRTLLGDLMRALLASGACLLAFGIGCAPAPAARPVIANQEPVALLILPVDVKAGVPVEVDASGSVDVDGSIASVEIDFGDGSDPRRLTAPFVVTHAWPSGGLYTVQLAVTDDDGLIGRARLPLEVAPPPDANAPVIDSVMLGDNLEDDARVPEGSTIAVRVTASDLEGNLDVAIVNGTSFAFNGDEAIGEIVVSSAIEVIAVDLFGNHSAPFTRTLTVLDPSADSDGDGLNDVGDPRPQIFNGLEVEVFEVESIDEDFLGNQRAERVVEGLAELSPVATFSVEGGYLAKNPGEETLDALPFHDAAPSINANFVLRYTGKLVPPADATHVVIEVGADDIGVVFLDGSAAASADEEYATDFFRFGRAPSTTEPLAISGETDVAIVLANGDGVSAWSVRFRFLSGDDTILNPEAVSQENFLVR